MASGPAAASPLVDDALTALARSADPAARVVLDDGQWWLEDPLGRLLLGAHRLEAARDLAQYVALLREAVPEDNRAAWIASVSAHRDDAPEPLVAPGVDSSDR